MLRVVGSRFEGLALYTLLLFACSRGPSTAEQAARPAAPGGAAGSSARPAPALDAASSAGAALQTLSVRERGTQQGYSRAEFGPAWKDVDRNGCDTRNDILRRDLLAPRLKQGSHCVVVDGSLHDPYSAQHLLFHRGVGTSTAIQIDHVVALSNAWQTGARQLPAARRAELANDPLNLLAVDGRLNEEKGDSDAAEWLPPNAGFRCRYVARQIAVKQRYQLWVTPAERTAMRGVLAGCPGEPLPTDEDAKRAARP